MDAYDAIVARRSVRNFKSDPVPDDILEKLANAGGWPPRALIASLSSFWW